jgi:hypothetical protein
VVKDGHGVRLRSPPVVIALTSLQKGGVREKRGEEMWDMKYSCEYKCPVESAEWKSGTRRVGEGTPSVLEWQRLKEAL